MKTKCKKEEYVCMSRSVEEAGESVLAKLFFVSRIIVFIFVRSLRVAPHTQTPTKKLTPHGFDVLVGDVGQRVDDDARADGGLGVSDLKALALLEHHALDGRERELHVLAGHDDLLAPRQAHPRRNVPRLAVQLRLVAGRERLLASALVLLHDVHLGLEVVVHLGTAGLDERHAASYVLALDAAQQDAELIAGLGVLERLVEHLDAVDGGLDELVVAAELERVALLADAALHTTGDDRAAARNRVRVLDGQAEGLGDLARWQLDVRVHGLHELEDGVAANLGTLVLESGQCRAAHEGRGVRVVAELLEQVLELHLDELDHLGVGRVRLVDEYDDVLDADLLGEAQMLLGLRHDAVGGGHDQDGAVHLRRARDHVLDVVGVAGTVDVAVVAVLGGVLDVRGVDGDAALALLGRVVDVLVLLGRAQLHLLQHGRDGRRERRLAVVDVADRADVDVRLVALVDELLLGGRCRVQANELVASGCRRRQRRRQHRKPRAERH